MTGASRPPAFIACENCGEPVEPDPDGSIGVWVHGRALGGRAFDLDSDHAAQPPEDTPWDRGFPQATAER